MSTSLFQLQKNYRDPKAVSKATASDQPYPFYMTEEQIMEQIKDKHSPEDQKPFDVDSLFIIVANILKRSTQIVDVSTKVYVYIHVNIDRLFRL